MSQVQDSSILHYRSRVPEVGLHRALQEAAADVDRLRDELGRRADRAMTRDFAIFALGASFAIGVIYLASCTVVSHEKVEGWPQLAVIEHHVPHAEMRDRCARYTAFGMPPEACAEFDLARGECHIWLSADFPPQGWIVEHERLHCAGYDHIGSNYLRSILRGRK